MVKVKRNSINNNESSLFLLLSPSEAIDTVEHEILLRKLEISGNQVKFLDILKSDFSEWRQFVCIENFYSEVRANKSAVL